MEITTLRMLQDATPRDFHRIAAVDCPLTFHGENLVNLRRVEIRRAAEHSGVDASGGKCDIIARLITHFRGNRTELSEVSK